MSKKIKIDFETYYSHLFAERWNVLKEALLESETAHFELKEGLRKSYFLDPASVIAAKALNVKPGENVLDLCAAPGGKSLVLASALKGEGSLISNDLSSARRGRLNKVIAEHLPENWAEIVSVYGHDASRWGLYQKNQHDAILADVPCSSERHVIQSPKHLEQWSESRIKGLVVRQFAILASAFDSLKPRGRLVYSTCAINSKENDGVIDKLFKKRKGLFKIESFDHPFELGEKTKYGILILPDVCNGLGPIFYSIIRKID